MDPDLYDEFGNYIGPELESESEDSSEEEREEEEEPKDEGMDQDDENEEGGQSMAIVLHEVCRWLDANILCVQTIFILTCHDLRIRSTIRQRVKCMVLMWRQSSMRRTLSHLQSPSSSLSERTSLNMWSRSCLRQPTPWSSLLI